MAMEVLTQIIFLMSFFCTFEQGYAEFTIFRGKEALEIDSQLSWSNADLLDSAAKTGQSVTVDLITSIQTVLTQHNVAVQFNCSALLASHGGKNANASWSKIQLDNEGKIDGYTDSLVESGRIYVIGGIRNSILSFNTTIYNDAGRSINSHGVFTCETCSSGTCFHNNVTLFIVGGPPIIDSHFSKGGDSYNVGTDFCLERLQTESLYNIELKCRTQEGESVSPALPQPTIQWKLNDDLVYHRENRSFDMDFLLTGDNLLFMPGYIYPTVLLVEPDSLVFNLQALNFTLVTYSFPDISDSNIQDKLFDLLLGEWTCIQNNTYGASIATTMISECVVPTTLIGFEVRKIFVTESDGSAEVCVHHTGSISQFRVYTSDVDAKKTTDYIAVNATRNVDKKCFRIDIVNDSITEAVETFHLSLEKAFSEDDVTFINQSLTIVIIDDDSEKSSASCNIEEYLLVDKIKEDKERVLENIVQELLPFEISTTNEGGQSELVYEELAHVFNRSASTEGHDKFVAAVDEIYTAYTTVCEGNTDVPGSETIAGLAASFDEVTQGLSTISTESLSQARSIYGELLCYQEKKRTTRRKKRQDEVVSPSECACPEELTEPCHFFACLSVSVIQHIMGFGNSALDQPCIGFLVDTSGSMGAEIAAAKRVILQFIKSQADSTVCYLLVPFNDFDDSHYHSYDYDSEDLLNVGPITYAFTQGESAAATLNELQQFEQAVNNMIAYGGGDYPEYALSAMKEALEYSLIDEYGEMFPPMHYNSEMIVITDATSKLPELEPKVIERANIQGVSIYFILSDHGGLTSYSIYPNIANETGGIVYRGNHAAWSIIEFIIGLPEDDSEEERKKRLALPTELTVEVSRLTFSLKVSTLTRGLSSGTATITAPDKTVELETIEDGVMIYLKANPLPGVYMFDIDTVVNDYLVEQDVSLDTSLFYFDNNFTVSALTPLAACTSGKLALTTSRIEEISSLTLNVTGSDGSSQLIPLNKCSNAFICDYAFTAGTFYYNILGVDSNEIEFVYNLNKSVVITSSPDSFSLRSITPDMTVDFTETFNMKFELLSNDTIGTMNFSLSVAAEGFVASLSHSLVQLGPKQSQVVTLSGLAGSTVGGGKTSVLTVTASNECVTLTASSSVTVRVIVAIPPSMTITNVCGCLNGGTCTELTRRGRTFRRCNCPPGYAGSRCEMY